MAQPGILSSQIPPGEDWVPRALADIRREMRELGPSIMHSFQGVVDELAAHQATLDAQQATLTAQQATLTTTVADLTTAQATLATTVADLTTAQATLATTVSGLSTAQADIAANVVDIAANVADINTLVGQQVTGGTGNANSGVVTFTTGYVTYATVTIAVPTGYSVAKVIGISSAFCPGSGGAMTVRTRILGNVGNAMTGVTDSSISHALTVTGLGGATTSITIATDVMVNTAASGAANTSAFVTFLR